MGMRMRTIDKVGSVLVVIWGFVFTVLAILLSWSIL